MVRSCFSTGRGIGVGVPGELWMGGATLMGVLSWNGAGGGRGSKGHLGVNGMGEDGESERRVFWEFEGLVAVS